MDRKLGLLIGIWIFLLLVVIGGIFALVKIGTLSLKAKSLGTISGAYGLINTPLDRTILILILVFLIILAIILMIILFKNFKIEKMRGKNE